MVHGRSVSFFCALATGLVLLQGCGAGTSLAPVAGGPLLPVVSGRVHGGQQPVSGAAIQLYAANGSVAKGVATPLLTSSVLTGAGGQFTITGDYSCPSASTQVYLVATGGNPGLGPAGANPNLSLMAALGSCGTLNASTLININELTTVAAVISLAPFMADMTHVGADAANTAGLPGAFAGAQSMVDVSSGQPPAVTSGLTPPVAILNTLADILAACVNTAGGTAGDGTACGSLFQYATNGSTTDTVTAMLHIAQLPGQNVAQLFSLVVPSGPFQPVLPVTPVSWILPLSVALPLGSPYNVFHVVVDKAQHIWVDLQTINNGSYVSGPLVVLDGWGNLLATIQPGSGGLNAPVQMLADPLGNVWTVNNNFTLSKFDANGNPLSPPAGFTFLVNASQPPPIIPLLAPVAPGPETFVSFDQSGNLWGLGSGTTSNCLVKINNAGSVITPTGNFCGTANNSLAIAVANDGVGNVWVSGSGSVSKGSPSGTYLNSGVNSNGCFSLNSTDFSIGTADAETLYLAYDRVHDQLWGVGDTTVGLLRSDGTQVSCRVGSAGLPVIPYTRIADPAEYYADFIGPSALDGAGTLWFITSGAQGYTTNAGDSTIVIDALGAIDYTGKLLTPYVPAPIVGSAFGPFGVYGLSDSQVLVSSGPTGFLVSASIGGTNNQGGLAVDASGDLWTAGTAGAGLRLVKIPGLAVPKP